MDVFIVSDYLTRMSKMEGARKTVKQFIRYVFAGGAAFVVDFAALVACRELLFRDYACGVYASVLIAFMAGHIVNYTFSLWFVFNDPEERRRGLTIKSFVLFALCALGGMLVTEIGMWIGYGIIQLHYVIVKVIMAAIVFVLNFMGRKMIVS